MRRLFWLTLGAMLGAWAVLRVQRFARQFGPRGMADRAVGLGGALRAFAADVRVQMNQREAELRGAPNGTHDHFAPHHGPYDIDKDGH